MEIKNNQCIIGGTILWDITDLVGSIDSGHLIMEESDSAPQKLGDSYVRLAKTRINLRSTINPTATSDEFLTAWTFANSDFPLYRLMKVLMVEYARNLNPVIRGQLNICELDPPIIELMRMAYYYYKCDNAQTKNDLDHKRSEIRGKLQRKLLRKLEEYSSGEITYDSDANLEALIESSLEKLKTDKALDNKFRDRIWQWIKSISSINSELTFAVCQCELYFCIT